MSAIHHLEKKSKWMIYVLWNKLFLFIYLQKNSPIISHTNFWILLGEKKAVIDYIFINDKLEVEQVLDVPSDELVSK